MTPAYYATGILADGFDLRGKHFYGLPSDAVGILSLQNNYPHSYRNTQDNTFVFDIVQRDNAAMRLEAREVGSHPQAVYLGCIVSADRQTIYWENTSKPLPRES